LNVPAGPSRARPANRPSAAPSDRRWLVRVSNGRLGARRASRLRRVRVGRTAASLTAAGWVALRTRPEHRSRFKGRAQIAAYHSSELSTGFSLLGAKGSRNLMNGGSYPGCSDDVHRGRACQGRWLVHHGRTNPAVWEYIALPEPHPHQRRVPITPKLAAGIKRYEARQRPQVPYPELLINHLGRPYRRYGINEMMDRLMKRTGFRVHAHAFRHTFATVAPKLGWNFEHLRAAMSHADYAVLQRYVRLATDRDLGPLRKWTDLIVKNPSLDIN
jgi:hypothetical protein